MGYFPTYLYFHPSSYVFRIRVPCDIIPRLGKTEIRRSVKTLSRTLAIQRGIRMYTKTQSIFKGLRGGGRMAELSKKEINAMLDLWLKEGLEDDENERIMRGPKSESEQMYLPLVYTDILYEIDAELTYGDFSRISGFVDALLSEKGMELDPDS